MRLKLARKGVVGSARSGLFSSSTSAVSLSTSSTQIFSMMYLQAEDLPKPAIPFGHQMRNANFSYDKSYTPLNHGSYGAYPKIVREYQRSLQDQIDAQPDLFTRLTIPALLDESRAAVAPLLGIQVDELVFVPNVTTALNAVLWNLKYESGDVVLFFSTIYDACEKMIASICETTPAESLCIPLHFPVEDADLLRKFCKMVENVRNDGRRVKIAIFDTVVAFPGVRMPWEALVKACKDLGVLSLVDGAHGVGHLDLTHLGDSGPDFFTSNCYKWLYVPRGSAVLYVPLRNQHLIRTTLPTSRGFRPSRTETTESSRSPLSDGKNLFVEMFAWVATVDQTPYVCALKALQFRETVCGGEDKIRDYCHDIVNAGAQRVAEILGTEVMDNKSRTLSRCCFANVRLPLPFRRQEGLDDGGAYVEKDSVNTPSRDHGYFSVDEAPRIAKWIMERTVWDFDTFIPAKFHARDMWVRLSGQIYLELGDFEWAGHMLKGLCERVLRGESKAET